MMYLREHFHQK